MAGQTVIVSVLADTKKFAQGMDSIGGSTSKFASGVKALGVATVAAVGAAAVALGTFAVKSIGAASDLEQAIGGVDAVFKDNAATVHAWAASAAQDLGLNKTQYSELATVIGSQLKNMGVATEAVAGQTNDLIGIGADLAAQFGGSTSDAVSALSSLLRGERDPIERYGVSINEAAIKAKMAEMGLSGLTGEAEKNAKTQATLALLMEQTADAQGAFARESDTLAGKQARLRASFENVVTTIGTALLPAATMVTGVIGELLTKITESEGFNSFIEGLSNMVKGFTDASSGSGNLISTIVTLVRSFSPLNILFKAIQPILPQLASAFGEIGRILSSGLAAILPKITPLLDAVAGVVGNLISALLPPLVTIFGAVVNVITALLPPIIEVVTMLIDFFVPVVEQLTPLLSMLGEIIGEALNAVLPILTQLLEAVMVIFEALFPVLTPIIDAVLGIVKAFAPLIVQLVDLASAILKPVIDLLVALLEPILALIAPLLDMLAPALTFVAEVLANVIGWVVEAITWFINLITGSEEAKQGIETVWNNILNFFAGIPAAIGNFFSNAINFLKSAGVNIINGLRNGITGTISNVWNFLQGIPKSVMNFFSNAGTWLKNAGKNILIGLINGIGGAAQWLYDTIRNTVGNVINFAKKLLGIASPSKVFKKFGRWTIQGLEQGLAAPNKLDSVMAGITGQVTNGFRPSIAMDVSGSGGRFGGTEYNINVTTGVGDPVEIGRVVTEYIREYNRFGGVPA